MSRTQTLFSHIGAMALGALLILGGLVFAIVGGHANITMHNSYQVSGIGIKDLEDMSIKEVNCSVHRPLLVRLPKESPVTIVAYGNSINSQYVGKSFYLVSNEFTNPYKSKELTGAGFSYMGRSAPLGENSTIARNLVEACESAVAFKF